MKKSTLNLYHISTLIILIIGYIHYALFREFFAWTGIEQTVLNSFYPSLDSIFPDWYLGSLPSFVLVSFTIFCRLAIDQNKCASLNSLLKICIGWTFLALLLETMQHRALYSVMPGTFDKLDLLATALGGLTTFGVVLLISFTGNIKTQKQLPPSLFRCTKKQLICEATKKHAGQ